MAEADIAYVATAGAAGLALALSAWAARLRGRLAARNRVAESELATALVDLADRDGALAAFEDVRLALTPDGQTRRLGSPQAWAALTRELASEEDHERDPGLVVLDAARRAAGPRLDALIDQGEAFDAFRFALFEHAPDRPERLEAPMFALAEPEEMLIDEVEAVWAAIEADDDWAPFEAKIRRLRETGQARG